MNVSTSLSNHGNRRGYFIDTTHSVALERQPRLDIYIDPITRCPNRHYLLEVLEPQIAVSRQYGFPLALMLGEIAHFRQIEFTFGDTVANSIVQDIAQLLQKTVRVTDLVIRYAEETFAILLLHSTQFGAARVCERLKAAIARHPFPARESDLVVIVNFGVAEQSAEADLHGRGLINSAEEALRHAVTAGDGAIVRFADLRAAR